MEATLNYPGRAGRGNSKCSEGGMDGLWEENPEFEDVYALCHIRLHGRTKSCSCRSLFKAVALMILFFTAVRLEAGHGMNTQANYSLMVLFRSQCINIGMHS